MRDSISVGSGWPSQYGISSIQASTGLLVKSLVWADPLQPSSLSRFIKDVGTMKNMGIMILMGHPLSRTAPELCDISDGHAVSHSDNGCQCTFFFGGGHVK